MKELLPHHKVWLDAHPHRDRAWLMEKIMDGFDLHHVDGDHTNNNPSNLVLIEHTDHMMLHSGKWILKRGYNSNARREKNKSRKADWDKALAHIHKVLNRYNPQPENE